MWGALVQWSISGILLLLLVYLKLDRAAQCAGKLSEVAKHCVQQNIKIVLSALFGLLFLDPLIGGPATIIVHEPDSQFSGRENWRARIEPEPFIPGQRVDTSGEPDMPFDSSGTLQRRVHFRWGQTQVGVMLYNLNSPGNAVSRAYYVSPFVRRGLWYAHIYIRKP